MTSIDAKTVILKDNSTGEYLIPYTESYELPIASTDTSGGVMADGSTITITDEGVISTGLLNCYTKDEIDALLGDISSLLETQTDTETATDEDTETNTTTDITGDTTTDIERQTVTDDDDVLIGDDIIVDPL